MIVADTNLVVALLMKHPGNAVAEAIYLRDSHWCAPPLMLSELRNVGLGYVRRRLLSMPDFLAVMAEARRLVPAGRRHEVDDEVVLKLAIDSGCTAYDCEYVMVAELLDVPLVTWDRELLAAFPDRAVLPEGFAAPEAES